MKDNRSDSTGNWTTIIQFKLEHSIGLCTLYFGIDKCIDAAKKTMYFIEYFK